MPEAQIAPAVGRVDPERAKQTSLAALNKAITAIGRSAVKLNEQIHATAVACMEHTRGVGNGDTGPCARLVDALPVSHRRSLLIGWFAQFSPITIGKDGKTGLMKAHLKGTAEEREGLWMIPEAKATPFYAMPDAEREPDVPTYDKVHNNILNFIKRVKATADKIDNQDEKVKAIAEITKLERAVAA